MFPYLLKAGAFSIPSYFFFMTVGFLAAFSVAIWQGRKFGIEGKKCVDFCIVAYVCSLVGAKALHVVVEPSGFYAEDWLRVFYVWNGGFVFYGGFALAVLGLLLYIALVRIRLGDAADMAAPAMWFGLGIGRIGCLASGCCYGAATSWWWGITFREVQGMKPFAKPLDVPLHPTQPLEMLGCFVLVALSLWLNRRRRVPGLTFLVAVMGYAVLRFVLEFLRGDSERGIWFGDKFSTSQLISMPVFVIAFGIALVLVMRQRVRRRDNAQ